MRVSNDAESSGIFDSKHADDDGDEDRRGGGLNNAMTAVESYPRAIVLAPNRELVQQILMMAAPVADGLALRIGAARGGLGGRSGSGVPSSSHSCTS